MQLVQRKKFKKPKITDTVTLAYVPATKKTERVETNPSRELLTGPVCASITVTALAHEIFHVVDGRLRAKIRHSLRPGGAARDPEDRPNESDEQIDERKAFVVSILPIEENVDDEQCERDEHRRHAGEHEELRRWLDVVR